jgi:hypothetical protein
LVIPADKGHYQAKYTYLHIPQPIQKENISINIHKNPETEMC